MQRIGHKLLETRILNSGYAFGSFKIRRRQVASFLPLASIVDQKFRHFSERSPLLAIVHDQAESAGLGHAHAFLDAVNEIWTTRADIGTENVRSTALVMHAA